MSEETGEKQRQARRWPWVLITVGLLFVVIVALSITHPKPLIQLAYVGPSDIQLNEEFFWATNASSREVMLQVKSVERNNLGQWLSSSYSKAPWLSAAAFFRIPPHEQIRFGLDRQSGVNAWRPQFTVYTEAKGWEIYWWYVKGCCASLLHGGALLQFSKPQAHVFGTSREVVGPVVAGTNSISVKSGIIQSVYEVK